MKCGRVVPAALLLSVMALAAGGDIVGAVRSASDAHDFALADREIQSYRNSVGVTAEFLEALSWLARGALDAGQNDRADRYATETHNLSLDMLKHGGPTPAALGTALGASIEVHGQVLAARGERTEAIAYLKKELATWHATPLAPRIQKNINLLTMEGKPAPLLETTPSLGLQPKPISALKGHPVLLFFWAHWCSDCKAEVPILAQIMQNYGPKGLLLIAPTQLYGFTSVGDAAPEVETRYIEQVRKQYYAALGNLSIPVNAQNFIRYGCSTTPTVVLLDGNGVVRLYHPGAMTYDALAAKIKAILSARG